MWRCHDGRVTGRITSKTKILQLRIDVLDITPPVWRRVQVPGETSLAELHQVVQNAVGWYDSHLHEFEIDGVSYGMPDPDGWSLDEVHDESTTRLDRVVAAGDRFRYTYDFGDNWRHVLHVEKVLTPEPGLRYPRCIAGRRACPAEDVGGPWGYAEFLEALADPAHPDHKDRVEWIGGASFDAEDFDVDEFDEQLERLAWQPLAVR